jgi:hypothetical protein
VRPQTQGMSQEMNPSNQNQGEKDGFPCHLITLWMTYQASATRPRTVRENRIQMSHSFFTAAPGGIVVENNHRQTQSRIYQESRR